MTRTFGLAVAAVFLIAAPAHAQLSPVYGSLRTALENTIAQTFPPYGVKPDGKSRGAEANQADASQTGNTAASAGSSAGKIVGGASNAPAADNNPVR